MNERIRELMEQASSNACYDEPNQLHLMNDEIEKFAELIVRECASICYNSSLLDADAHAQNLLYEFNIDDCRNQK